jgi:hypothetical protein
LTWLEYESPVSLALSMLIYHICETKFELCIENLGFFLIYEGPVLFIVVDVAVIENLIVLAIEIHLILGPTLLAQGNK